MDYRESEDMWFASMPTQTWIEHWQIQLAVAIGRGDYPAGITPSSELQEALRELVALSDAIS
jgi:hypothetical protein